MWKGFAVEKEVKFDYLIESLLAVSLVMVDEESLIIFVESDDIVLIVELLSVTVVADSVVSVFVLEQAVAKAIIERRKNADFAMFLSRIKLVSIRENLPLIRSNKKSNPCSSIIFQTNVCFIEFHTPNLEHTVYES